MRYQRILAFLLLALSCPWPAAAQVFDRDQFQAWGLSIYQETWETLGIPGQALLAETADLSGHQSGGAGGRAFVWPLSAQFRVQNRLAEIDPWMYDAELRDFADQLHTNYWKSSGGGYEYCAPGGERFYDDNAHLAVALAEAHQITGAPIYLTRAIDTLEFVLSGEDDVGGGGIYWSEWDHGFKDSAATLQGARAALMVYQATGETHFLEDALRLYDWAAMTTQQTDGLFMEKLYLTGPKAGQVGDYTLVNFAGFAVAANALFYEVTGDRAHLAEAQRIASRSISRFTDRSTGRINDEGFWAYELVDAWLQLHELDSDQRWLQAAVDGLEWLHINKEDPNGHYGKFWGREGVQTRPLTSWHLNDQAPVARAYFSLAAVHPSLNGDFNHTRRLDAEDLDRLTAALADGETDTFFDLDGDRRVTAQDRNHWIHDLAQTDVGDADLNGRFDSQDFVTAFQAGEYEDGVPRNSGWAEGDWDGNQEFESSDFVAAFQTGRYEQGPRIEVTAVPEPTGWCLMLLAIASLLMKHGRHDVAG